MSTDFRAAIGATRAPLVHPEGEGLGLAEIDELCAEFGFHYDDDQGETLQILQEIIGAARTRWGRPATLEHVSGSITDEQREAVRAAVAEALGDTYDCTRVWEAWQVGTMGPDDFELVAEDEERVAAIADAAIEALRPATPPPLPSNYIDPEHQGEELELLQTFYRACRAEGGTADEIHLKGIRAVLAARPATPPAPEPGEMARCLADSLSAFKITQEPAIYPAGHWSRRAVNLLAQRPQWLAPPAPEMMEAVGNCARIELLVALYSLASQFENETAAFTSDDLKAVQGHIRHARKIAARHNQNGPGCAPPAPEAGEVGEVVEWLESQAAHLRKMQEIGALRRDVPIRLDEGRVQRGGFGSGPTTPKPLIKPQPTSGRQIPPFP